MANVAIFDEGASPEKVLGYLKSVNTPDYSARTDVVINPDVSALEGIVPQKYWKHDTGAIIEMTAQEKSDQDAADAAEADLNVRTDGKAFYDGQTEQGLALRAFADVVKDEINILRAEHALAARTLSQLKSAIQSRIDSGDVDE